MHGLHIANTQSARRFLADHRSDFCESRLLLHKYASTALTRISHLQKKKKKAKKNKQQSLMQTAGEGAYCPYRKPMHYHVIVSSLEDFQIIYKITINVPNSF
jgi:hypothetical protein